jgi:glyoxylate/hydroxypyruvate reductase A
MAGAMRGAVLIASGPWAPEPWAAMVEALDPGREVAIWPDVPDREAIGYVMAWKPPAEALAGLPNLKAIFSLGAGVDHIVLGPPLPDVPVVRIVSPDLTARMTEWVTLQVLLHHRRQRDYDRQQRERLWKELEQPPASAVRVGIMGMGELGRAAAEMLLRLGFAVAGWSRRRAEVPGVAAFRGAGQLDAFLSGTDILVVLLPLTPETRGLLSLELFRRLARDGAMPNGPVLINAGRGGLQVEADIAAALRDGVLGGASLDVFETEPLDPANPLWGLDNLVITPHVAAPSEPEELARQIVEQIRAFEAGKPLRNVIDRSAGY